MLGGFPDDFRYVLGLQEAVVKATLPVFFPSDRNAPFGFQAPELLGHPGRRVHVLLRRGGD